MPNQLPSAERPHVAPALAELRTWLNPHFLASHTILQVRNAGCEVKGVRYFQELFAPEGSTVTSEHRLASAYVGATAFGDEVARQKARSALYGMQTIRDTREFLSQAVDQAIQLERVVPNRLHLDRLQSASTELGKPLLRRWAGQFVTAFMLAPLR